MSARPKAVTTSQKVLRRFMRDQTPESKAQFKSALAELELARPVTRGHCQDGPRPCPFFSCRFNLVFDINPGSGSIKHNFPGVALEDIRETCALDVADRGGITLEEIGAAMNLTRERVRQLEEKGVQKLKQTVEALP